MDKEQRTKNKEQRSDKDTSEVTRRGSSDGGGISDLPWDSEITKKWLPVNQYTGGAEHTVLHLLYARFITMAFKDMSYLNFEEPFSHFYAHGLIIAEGAKMSKSRGNIVVPDEYINKYGADTLRTYLMFLGPFDQGGDFRDTGVAGMHRFLSRVWRLVNENGKDTSDGGPDSIGDSSEVEELRLTRFMHRTIKEVTGDLENFRYNTAIAHIMELVNEFQKTENIEQRTEENIIVLLLLLAPFAPHMTEELWQRIKKQKTENKEQKKFESIHIHPWPEYEEKFLEEEMVTIIVQVNGKLRETINVKKQKTKNKKQIEEIAKLSDKVKKYIEGKKVRRTVFVPGKLINFVI